MMSEQRFQRRLPERSSSPNLRCNSEEWITAAIHIPGIKELSFLPAAICPRSQNAHRAARAGTDLGSVTPTPKCLSAASRLRAWEGGRMEQNSGGQGQISQGQISRALEKAQPSPHWLVCPRLIHRLCLWLSPIRLSASESRCSLNPWDQLQIMENNQQSAKAHAHSCISSFLNAMLIPSSIPRFCSVIHKRSKKLRQACQSSSHHNLQRRYCLVIWKMF